MASFHDGGAQSAAMHRPISVADARLTIELLKSQVDGDPSLKRHCDQMLEGLDQHEAHSMPRLRSVSSPLAASTAVRRNSSSSGGVAASTKKGRVEEPPLSLLLLRKYELDAMVKQGLVEADAANLTAGYFGGSEWVAVCYWILGSLVFAFVTFLLLWHQWISRAFWEVGAAIFTVMGKLLLKPKMKSALPNAIVTSAPNVMCEAVPSPAHTHTHTHTHTHSLTHAHTHTHTHAHMHTYHPFMLTFARIPNGFIGHARLPKVFLSLPVQFY